MKNFLLVLLWLFLSALWEIIVSPSISISGVKPDIGIAILVYLALYYGIGTALFFGFFWGIIIDSVTPGNLGLSSLLYVLTGYMIIFIRTHFEWSSPIAQSLIVLFAAFLFSGVFFLITNIGEPGGLFYYIIRYGITSALYTMVIWWVGQFFFGAPQDRIPV